MTTSSETAADARPSGGQGEAGRPGNPSGRSRPAAGTQTRRPGGGGGGRGGGGGGRRPWGRRKVCQFCVDHVGYVDYKSVSRIRRYISERSRMESSKRTGTCTRHQRMLRTAILRARHMALLPYAPNHTRVTSVVQVVEPVAEIPPEDLETPAEEGSDAAVATDSAEESKPEGDSEEDGSESSEPEVKAEDDSPEDAADAGEPEESPEDLADAGESEEPDDAVGESESDDGDVTQDEDDEEKSKS